MSILNNFRKHLPIIILVFSICFSVFLVAYSLNYSFASHGPGIAPPPDECSGNSCGEKAAYDSNNQFCGNCQRPCENSGEHGALECKDCGCEFSGGGNGGGDEEKEPDPPIVDIKANSSDGPITISYNASVLLSWDSHNSSNCQATGGWSGGKPDRGSEGTGNLTSDTTFALTCYGPKESRTDSVFVDVNIPPPNNPSNVTATQPNYCVSGPAATVNWSYSDPSGSPQQSYQIQVDNQGSFQSPDRDSGKVNSGSTSYFTGQGYLQFNTTYKTRVKVWNTYDQASGWTESGSFKTPNFAYPQINFTWTQSGFNEPMNPQLNKLIQFIDQTVFGGNPLQREWDWLFGDGTSSTQQNPAKTYVSEGTYYITLTAEDSQGQTCSKTKGPLSIQKPIPIWKEIAPR